MTESRSVFDVLYTKDGKKKRKTFHDGILTCTKKSSGCIVVLQDDNSKEIFRKSLALKTYQSGTEIKLGIYDVQIEKENCMGQSSHSDEPEKHIPNSQVPKIKRTSLMNPLKSRNPLNRLARRPVELDESLQRTMHPHQIEGAHFLLRCLDDSIPCEVNLYKTSEYRDEEHGLYSDDEFVQSSGTSGSTELHERHRGVILADEMGLGKTLTAISVLWAYVKGGRAKGVVVCPSSLVDNWEKEILRWMGVRMKPLCVRSGNSAAATVNTFRVGHVSMCPVMIISYEMFRKFVDEINKVPNLEIVVCDEGHRLKNANGTKTTLALGSCRATKRVVLTGTPIQNDLEELFAILQFVLPPSRLGSLSSFKHRVIDPIKLYNEQCAQAGRSTSGVHPSIAESASKASALLENVLGKVMLRRTQQEILRRLLPPRREFVLGCRLTSLQEDAYEAVAKEVITSSSDIEHNTADYWYSECEDAVVGSVGSEGEGMVLPALQKLRQICNAQTSHVMPNADSALTTGKRKITEMSSSSSASGTHVGVAAAHSSKSGDVTAEEIEQMLQRSSKLQILDAFITSLCQKRNKHPSGFSSDNGKLVLVSSFTSMLDCIQTVARYRGWEFLRLDGKTTVDKRQGLVDRFNRQNDDSFLFLLSSRAGGVGLNLIAANRLVMVDADWNPAVDSQAMARVWREGQKRPVFVYRLVASNRIEEEILERQKSKEKFHSVLGGKSDTLKSESLSTAPPETKGRSSSGGGIFGDLQDINAGPVKAGAVKGEEDGDDFYDEPAGLPSACYCPLSPTHQAEAVMASSTSSCSSGYIQTSILPVRASRQDVASLVWPKGPSTSVRRSNPCEDEGGRSMVACPCPVGDRVLQETCEGCISILESITEIDS